MAGIHFDITGENKNFLQSLKGAESGVKQTANVLEQYGSQIEGMFNKIKTAAELSLAGFTVKGFVEKVATVRGEFQQLEAAFETMLGSADKARAMMSDLTKLAATTPFDLQGVANGAKQLLAYGMEASKITDTLRRLGDVAAGLGVSIGDLTYLYGTTMAQGRMYTQDLNQFTGRGIPMIRELAKQFGVAESEVKDLVTAGKVGFPEVEKVIMSLTNKGGQFGGLMEAQSKTIVGQISNIEDSIDMMFNELGKSSEGAINTVLSGVSYAVEHYKEFGSVILGLVASYGEWKAAAMVVNSWHNMILNQSKDIEATRQADLESLAKKYNSVDDSATTNASTAAIEQNTIARNANRSAIDGEIAAIEASLKSKLAEAEAEYTSAKAKESNALADVETAQEMADSAKEKLDAALELGDAEAIESANLEANAAATMQNSAQKNLLTAREEVSTAVTNKNTAATRLNTFQTEVDTVQKKASTTATGIWAAVTKTATTAVRGLTAAIAANPIGALLVGITTALSLIPMFTSDAEEASAEVTRFGEAAVKQMNNVETLMGVIESTSEKSNVHKEATEDLIKVYEEYGIHIDDEHSKLQQLIDKHDELIKKIREEGEERQKANLIQSYTEGIDKAVTEMQEAWSKAYKNAEFDSSSLIDDWDADDYQKKADQIAFVANAIAQSEMEKLQGIIESGGKVTEQTIKETIRNAQERIEAESEKIAGSSLYSVSYDEIGNEIRHYVDVDYEGIMQDYADKVLNLAGARRELVQEIKDTKSNIDEETDSVDYSAMSFSDLIDKAYGAKSAVKDVGNTDGTPTISTDPADNATTAIEGTQSSLLNLNGMSATPLINTTSIGNALTMTGGLIQNMNVLSGSPLFNGTPGLPKFGFNVGTPKLGFDMKQFNFGSSMYGFNPIAGNERLSAVREITNRVKNAKSDSKVDKLLKEVNDALKDAEYGSNERGELLKLQKQLQDRKKANSSSAKKDADKKKKEAAKNAEAARKKAEKVEAEQERLADMEDENALQRIRKAQDLADKLTNARLEAEGKGADILKSQRDQQNKEEIQSIERERDDAIKAYVEAEKRIFEQKEKIKKTRNDKYKERKFDESKVDISAIKAQYDEIIAYTKQRQEQVFKDEDFEALNSFLIEYGSFEEKKLAITQKYEKEIREAQTMGAQLTLRAKMEQELKELKESMVQATDWGTIFGSLAEYSLTYLEEIKAKIKAELKKQDLDPSDAKTLVDKLNEVNSQIRTKKNEWKHMFGLAIPELERINQLEEEAKVAEDNLHAAQDDLNTKLAEELALREQIAQFLSQQTGQTFTAEDIKLGDVQKYVDLLKGSGANSNTMSQFGVLLSKLGSKDSEVTSAKGAVATAASQSTAANQAASGAGGGASTLAVTDAIIHGVNDNLQNLSKLIEDFGLSETEAGQRIQKFAESSRYATDAFDSLKKGDIVGVGLNLAHAFDTLGETFGFWGDSDKSLQKDIERLTGVNNELINAVDRLAAVMEKGNVADATETYQKQKADIEAAMANTQEMMSRSANASKSGLFGKHSSSYKIDKGMSDADWSRISKLVGTTVRSAGDFFNLTSKQMAEIATNAPDLYAKLKDLADDGYKNAAQFMDDYINYAEQLEKIEDAWREKMTSTSFDSVRDGFRDLMSDMDSDVSDFADKFEETMKKAVIESLMDAYNSDLKKWYADFAEAMKSDGELTPAEQAELKKRWEDMAASAIAARDKMYDTMGWAGSYKQSASVGSFQNMGEETANELNGRFTAVQIHTADTAERMLTTIELLNGMSASQASQSLILSEIRNMMIDNNSYLEDMVKYAKMTYSKFGDKLDDIVNNTKNL